MRHLRVLQQVVDQELRLFPTGLAFGIKIWSGEAS